MFRLCILCCAQHIPPLPAGPHIYDIEGPSRRDDDVVIRKHLASYREVKAETSLPVFVSELHVFNDEGNEEVEFDSTRFLLRQLIDLEVGWAMWTWKGVEVGHWALELVGCGRDVDVGKDSVAQIEDCWRNLMIDAKSNDKLKANYRQVLTGTSVR